MFVLSLPNVNYLKRNVPINLEMLQKRDVRAQIGGQYRFYILIIYENQNTLSFF